jgi:ATP-dependent Lon protease
MLLARNQQPKQPVTMTGKLTLTGEVLPVDDGQRVWILRS